MGREGGRERKREKRYIESKKRRVSDKGPKNKFINNLYTTRKRNKEKAIDCLQFSVFYK